jgi:DNA modification methylase
VPLVAAALGSPGSEPGFQEAPNAAGSTAASPYYADDQVTLHLGDCLDVLREIPDASVDAVVCDPPYSLAFMGRTWDTHDTPRAFQAWCETWAAECLRVLKPGGHLLAFGAPRTYHRLAAGIEDAGFEVRDSIHWIYGSGFPKGQDVGKAIDKHRDDRPGILQVTAWLAGARDEAGWTNARIDALFGTNGMGGLWTTQGVAAIVPRLEQWATIRDAIGFDDTEVLPLVEHLNGRKGERGEAWGQREVIGERRIDPRKSEHLYGEFSGDGRITLPASDAAKSWAGWNTQIKPAHEPIIVARKSTGFNTTVANVLEWGTGALNIDACRTGRQDGDRVEYGVDGDEASAASVGNITGRRSRVAYEPNEGGRWPTNVLFGHSPGCAWPYACAPGCPVLELDSRSVGGSRFFPAFRYQAKAAASERPRLSDGAQHATVKPLELMRWLARLVTPPGGTILDPFAGSGTTLSAAVIEGFQAIGIEREQPHADLCVARLSKPLQPSLFGDIEGGAS